MAIAARANQLHIMTLGAKGPGAVMGATLNEAESSQFIRAGTVRIHYNQVGSGPPLICLHGGGPGAASWSNFARNIEAFAKHYRVLLVDLPRFGKSEKPAFGGPQLTELGTVMRDFMEAMKIDRARYVGNSFGGQVAIKLAIDFPERVDALVVIGSAPVVHSIFAPMPSEGVKLIGDYYRGDGGPTLEKMRQMMRALVYDQSLITEEMVRERYERSTDPDAVRVMSAPPPARQDLTPEFGKVKTPTLVIWGMDDRAAALDIGLLMVRTFQDAQMHIFSRCGHWPQFEHADAFNELVLSFFRRDVRRQVATRGC